MPHFDVVGIWSDSLVNHLDTSSSAVTGNGFVRIVRVMKREFLLAKIVTWALLVDEENSSYGSLVWQFIIILLIAVFLISHINSGLDVLLFQVDKILPFISPRAFYVMNLAHEFYRLMHVYVALDFDVLDFYLTCLLWLIVFVFCSRQGAIKIVLGAMEIRRVFRCSKVFQNCI